MAGKKRRWQSQITTIGKDRLITHGINQRDINTSFNYEEMVFLLIRGRRPSKIEGALLRHVILSHCSHGITGQSTLAVRMGADTGATFLSSAVGGFSVGAGSFHQGGLERAMDEIQAAYGSGNPKQYVLGKLAKKEIVYGFGHRFFKVDPRAKLLIDLCKKYEFSGEYVACAELMEEIMCDEKGVFMNIEAAGGAILLDLGFPTEIAALIILIGRGPMFAAAYMERLGELKQRKRFFPRISIYEEVVHEK